MKFHKAGLSDFINKKREIIFVLKNIHSPDVITCTIIKTIQN